MHFFTVYKQLENKQTAVENMVDADEARQIIKQAIIDYDRLILKK
jgi:inorganic pyrophosphatase